MREPAHAFKGIAGVADTSIGTAEADTANSVSPGRPSKKTTGRARPRVLDRQRRLSALSTGPNQRSVSAYPNPTERRECASSSPKYPCSAIVERRTRFARRGQSAGLFVDRVHDDQKSNARRRDSHGRLVGYRPTSKLDAGLRTNRCSLSGCLIRVISVTKSARSIILRRISSSEHHVGLRRSTVTPATLD